MSHWNCPNKTIIGGSGCRLHKYTLQSCSTDYRAWSSNANAVCERRRRERKCRPLLPFLICWRPGGMRCSLQKYIDDREGGGTETKKRKISPGTAGTSGIGRYGIQPWLCRSLRWYQVFRPKRYLQPWFTFLPVCTRVAVCY
jgi:hypothetical protein